MLFPIWHVEVCMDTRDKLYCLSIIMGFLFRALTRLWKPTTVSGPYRIIEKRPHFSITEFTLFSISWTQKLIIQQGCNCEFLVTGGHVDATRLLQREKKPIRGERKQENWTTQRRECSDKWDGERQEPRSDMFEETDCTVPNHEDVFLIVIYFIIRCGLFIWIIKQPKRLTLLKLTKRVNENIICIHLIF